MKKAYLTVFFCISLERMEPTKSYSVDDLIGGFSMIDPMFITKTAEEQTQAYPSKVWEHFQFIHIKSTGEVVKGWYKCNVSDCNKPYQNVKLGGGNAKLTRHLSRKHGIVINVKENVDNKEERSGETGDLEGEDEIYKLKASELNEALAIASSLGHKYGSISASVFMENIVSVTEPWSPSFASKIEETFDSNGIKNFVIKMNRVTEPNSIAPESNDKPSEQQKRKPDKRKIHSLDTDEQNIRVTRSRSCK